MLFLNVLNVSLLSYTDDTVEKRRVISEMQKIFFFFWGVQTKETTIPTLARKYILCEYDKNAGFLKSAQQELHYLFLQRY